MPIKCPIKRAEKQKEYSKRYYEKNKQKVMSSITANKKKNAERWRDFKATLSCTICGENHPATLDFHHIERDKSNKKIYEMISNSGWESLQKEMQKCIVLCSNCHRKHHDNERQLKKFSPAP